MSLRRWCSRFLIVPVLASVAACAAEDEAPENIRQIEWSDLQPEGEEEILDELYNNFYANLEQQRSTAPRLLSGLKNAGGPGENAPLLDMGPGSIPEGSDLDTMPQLGTFNTVPELDDAMVELPGFIVPLDLNGKYVKEFLFVPYFGACIHTPPPPPNQIVYVTVEEDLPQMETWMPYWAKGRMRTDKTYSDLGNTAYTMELTGLRPYE